MSGWTLGWRYKGDEMSTANSTVAPERNAGQGSDTEQENGVSRRDFLRVGGLSVVGLSQAALARGVAAFHQRRAIFIMMTGGPSQLETFDPKPDAHSSIRGPFSSIETTVPGLRFSSTLPLLSQRANQFAVVRTLAHEAAPIHEAGQQLLQTGRLSSSNAMFPHWGSIVASRVPARGAAPSCAIVNGPLDGTGVKAYHGQSSGILGVEFEPVMNSADPDSESDATSRMYGNSSFGRSLMKARQLIERGTSCVTVNLFDSLNQRITWDCHGEKNCGPATLMDYQSHLCPEFDRALSGLLDDLSQRGLLDDTLVVATGEFGRTPKINDQQGRDHWPSCWSGLIAGGKVTGGAVIGTSDASAAEPLDRPVSPAELTATLVAWCGVDPLTLTTQVGKTELALIPSSPLMELWG